MGKLVPMFIPQSSINADVPFQSLLNFFLFIWLEMADDALRPNGWEDLKRRNVVKLDRIKGARYRAFRKLIRAYSSCNSLFILVINCNAPSSISDHKSTYVLMLRNRDLSVRLSRLVIKIGRYLATFLNLIYRIKEFSDHLNRQIGRLCGNGFQSNC